MGADPSRDKPEKAYGHKPPQRPIRLQRKGILRCVRQCDGIPCKNAENGKIYHALRCSGRIGGKSCNNETLNVTALKACVKRIFTDMPIDKTAVINAVIKGLSRTDKPDIPALRRKIETLNAKKRRAVDLMLDGLITQQELIEQKSYYDSIIEKLSQEISSDRSVFETDKIRKTQKGFLISQAIRYGSWS